MLNETTPSPNMAPFYMIGSILVCIFSLSIYIFLPPSVSDLNRWMLTLLSGGFSAAMMYTVGSKNTAVLDLRLVKVRPYTLLVFVAFLMTCIGLSLHYMPEDWSFLKKFFGGIFGGTMAALCVTSNRLLSDSEVIL